MRISRILSNVLIIIYIIFLLFLLLFSLFVDLFSFLIVVTLVLSLIYIIFKLYKLKKIKVLRFLNKKVILIICFVFSFFLRIFLFSKFKDVSNLSADYLTFFNNAKAIAFGNQLSSRYLALFPYLFPYILVLGNFFKLFGISLSSVVLLNSIIDLIGGVICYYLIKKLFDSKYAFIALLLWLFNPFNILWCSVPAPIIIVNTCLVLCLYFVIIMINNISNIKLNIIFSLISGIVIGISNWFRPIMIILIIVLFIYYIYLFLRDKNLFFNLFFSFIVVCASYFFVNNLNNKILSAYINEIPSSNSSGWTIYVGSNYETGGKWFNDSDFTRMIESNDFNADDVHNYFRKKGIENYKKNGLKNIKLFIKKAITLGSGLTDTTIYSFNSTLYISSGKIIKFIMKFILNIFYFSLIILNLLSFYFLKNNKKDEALIFILLVLGFFSSNLLVEVSSRYFTPILVPLLVISCINLNRNGVVFSEKFKKHNSKSSKKNF